MSRKWWRIAGAPKPVYVYPSDSGRGKFKLVFIIVSATMILLAYFIEVFSSEIAFLLMSLLIFSQVFEVIYSLYRKTPGKTEESLAINLVKTLSRKIIAWSIPTKYIVASIKLSEGILVYIYMDKGSSYILAIKPTLFMGVILNKKYHTIKLMKPKKMRYSRFNDLIEVIAPNPENPRIWYRIVGRGFVEPTMNSEFNELVRKISQLILK